MQSQVPRFAALFMGSMALALGFAACSDDDTSGTPDAATGNDAAAEASPCGPLTLICKPGEPGKACSQVPTNAKCNGTTWECATGSISASLCGCAADTNRPVGSDCGKDAGTVDAADDAPAESGADASSDGGSNG